MKHRTSEISDDSVELSCVVQHHICHFNTWDLGNLLLLSHKVQPVASDLPAYSVFVIILFAEGKKLIFVVYHENLLHIVEPE